MRRPFQLSALTPPGLADPSIAIAASRAGESGVLNLEHALDETVARVAIARMARYAKGACGIKLDSSAPVFVDQVTSDLPEQVETVILTPWNPKALHCQVPDLHQRGLTILLEVTCLEQAQLGEALGVDGLIAKGNEAGGWIGEETTFILLQRLLSRFHLPVWSYGGIGLHTAAACYAAGAAGVVLDAQLALTRESPLPEKVKAAIARMDGSETACLGEELGQICRAYIRPGLPATEELRRVAISLTRDTRSRDEVVSTWRQAVKQRVGWESEQNVWLLGQDAAFAASLAERFRTVGGVLQGIRQAIQDHMQAAQRLRPLDQDAPLARSHGTRYPIVQGPMTRVSDRAEFALRVAEGGGLPFLALAMMRAPEVGRLLEETHQLLGRRPWGVGILGFVPLDLRQEQMDVIRQYRPPFALIAGGRPDQARALEKDGIPTYLHVPSPGLLQLFLKDGARRFVFEGRECGGHVGPRSSFVLWNTMVDLLLEELPDVGRRRSPLGNSSYHVLFAGGIHDALSASMVAAMAAPLAEHGVRIGVLLGTSYLLTEEAVASGAILPGFQEEALRCDHTVLLETGPGHVIRCVETPYVGEFEREKQRLLQEGRPAEDIREALEAMNVGRLRIASKGVVRHPRYGQDPDVPKFVTVGEEEQHAQGMYMIGQLAALRDRTCTIEELHHDIAVKGTERLAQFTPSLALPLGGGGLGGGERPCDVAIIGMGCLLPKAGDLQTYWENILNKVNAVTEVPPDRWDWRQYYDLDRKARDKSYSKWGGFLDDIPVDPTRYGIPPNAVRSIEPIQLLTLEVVRAALEDAGYLNRPFPRERTSVILGAGGGIGDLGQQYTVRASLPGLMGDVPPELLERLPEWTEDSFPGILLNVIAGRVANRFDLGGVNYVVDAACASSLAAVYLATRELETGTSDMVIAGGVDNVQNPFAFTAFSRTQALSPRGQCRTFDDSADGIAISEGLAIVVLKRLADAERDGDRIYAVIRGIGGSSDGRDKSLTAPRPEGQVRALERGYAKAGISPATVGLIEAHGTGTVVGDQAEVEALKQVFGAAGAARQGCAVGSVKSMIGHTKSAAGVAGLMKVALALYHKVLPPTLGVEKPNTRARFEESPFYVNTEPRPWVNGTREHARRAGVSAFGFGGTNFHAVVEEYTGDFSPPQATTQRWPSELLLWSAPSRQKLIADLASLEQALEQGAKPELVDLAYTLCTMDDGQRTTDDDLVRLAMVITSLDDLRQKLAQTRESLGAPGPVHIRDLRGIYYTEQPLAWLGKGQSEIRNPKSEIGKVAFLFPGQGSQYPNMLRDLAIQFPEVREQFELADRVLAGRFPQALSTYVFPLPAFSREDERAQQEALTQTNVAQPALGAADMGLFHLLQSLGVRPNLVAGHSYGEYVALCAAGVYTEEVLAMLSEARGRCIIEAAREDLGTMAAVRAEPERITEALSSLEDVWIANLNAPQQTIISGTRAGVEQAVERLKAHGMQARSIPVACAFHSPLVVPAQECLAEFLSTVEFAVPQLEVFSNTSAAPYPSDQKDIASLLAEHLVRPVRFADEVEAMYRAGARIFVEVGPRNVLTGLTRQILDGRPYVALAVDSPGRPGLTQLQHALGQLAAHGVPVQLGRLFQGRAVRQLDLSRLVEETAEKPLPPTTWLVNGGQARPVATAATTADRRPPTAATTDDRRPTTDDGGAGVSHPAIQPLGQTSLARHPATQPAASSQVMLQFQKLMDRFLETQRNVMLTYLQGAPPDAMPAPALQTGADAAEPREILAPGAPQETPEQESQGAGEQGSRGVREQGERDTTRRSVSPSPLLATAKRPSDQTTKRPGDQATKRPSDKETLTETLLAIVSERTGYPTEMLDLDLDIEAELGIDSIKRVEILGRLRHSFEDSYWEARHLDMEKLSRIKTLRGVIDRIAEGGPQPVVAQSDSHVVGSSGDQTTKRPRDHATTQPIQRFTLQCVDRPLPLQRGSLAPGRVVVVTDDGTGVANHLSDRLQDQGHPVALIRMDEGGRDREPGVYTTDLASEGAIERTLTLIRQDEGPICGLVHLLALRPGTDFDVLDLSGWRQHLHLETQSLFLLAKALQPDLEAAALAGGAVLVAATDMGGAFASDGVTRGTRFFPGQGAITGLLKTAAKEWPGVRVKAVDLNPQEPADVLAQRLLAEITADDGQVEVGYDGSGRLVLEPVLTPTDGASDPGLMMDPNWVLLVTGGARGITADVALELAERYQPTLLLVGRSPLPAPEEAADTSGLSSPQEIKAALINRLKRPGERPSLAEVEKAYHNLLREREMRRNLAAMQRAGSRVHYYSVDVRDEQAFGNLIDEIYQTYKRLDGVIHGAGIIEDKLLKDKTLESFDRVFSTKVEGAFILSRHLQPDSLRFLVFFSSVAGRFGNRGQADYAAANEVLNKLAVYLDRRWPGRVVSINWGPWDKQGMVTPELKREFTRRGVALVPPDVGCRRLDEEIRYGRKGEAEVIIGGIGDQL